ncbi:MAG: T9SS type A sorting domain-containing protein [Bacteroidota bacterium]
MKLKCIKSTLMFLLFVGIAYSQINNVTPVNIIDLDLIVKDVGNNEQQTIISSEPVINVYAGHVVYFRLNLKYESSLPTTRYYWFGYDAPKNSIGQVPAGTHIVDIPTDNGITAPILIPPVRKKKINRGVTYGYPVSIVSSIIPKENEQNFDVVVVMDEYENRKDYLQGINGKPSVVVYGFTVNVLPGDAFTPQIPAAEYLISTYPNPSRDHLTVQHTYTTPLGTPLQPTPLEVKIYDDQGNFVSQQTITSTDTNVYQTSYRIDTTQLVAGTYYFKLIHNGKATVKTVIKQ